MNLLLWICVSLIAVKSGDILINFSSSSPLVFLLHTVCYKKCLFLRNINVQLRCPALCRSAVRPVCLRSPSRAGRNVLLCGKVFFLGIAIGETVGLASSVIHGTG